MEKAEVRFQTHFLLSWTTWLRRQRREKSTFDTRMFYMIIWAFLSQHCEDFYHGCLRISSIIVTRVSDNNCHSYVLDENCLHILCFSEKRTPWAKNAIGQVETTQPTRQFSKWVQKNQYECACYKQNDSKKTDKLHIVEDKTRFAGRQATYFIKNCIKMWHFPMDVFVKWCEMVNGDSQFKDLFRGKYENMNVIKRGFQYQ